MALKYTVESEIITKLWLAIKWRCNILNAANNLIVNNFIIVVVAKKYFQQAD